MVDMDGEVSLEPIPAKYRDNLGLLALRPNRLADSVGEGLDRLSG
jgi:hypothetical protein